ncbi:uncharacterized protein LOC124268872 [Haliotis rubra]|uniref:uncharacterized protein LOC124268872 n=1 Tax=Haliotis rubra TaxID=36100 RepID=UPI001EE504EE|nr:uncharacterized protein LOC124268872 [Haliotis rubra]
MRNEFVSEICTSMMNNNFPSVKTYSTKWQRSYKLYHEKEGLFDRVQAQTRKNTGHRDDAKSDAVEKTVDNGSQQCSASMSSAKRQPMQKSLKTISKSQTATPTSSRDSPRPATVMSRPPTITSVSRAATTMAVSRPSVSNRVIHNKFPAGTPLIRKPARKHGAAIPRKPPVTRQAAAARTHISSSAAAAAAADPTHSPPKVLCTETLLRYHPEHAEKVHCKNDSYIHAWLRGVEEATGTERGGQHSNDCESSIELLRDAQVEHTGLARRNSASCLLTEMMNAFKSSSMEKSPELSVVKELPSLPEHPSGPMDIKAVSSQECKQTKRKLRKSRIPTPIRRLSSCSSQSVKESAKTHEEDSSHTYTYRWTMASPTREGDTQTKSISSAGCTGRLTRKRLNSTTKPCAMSLGKVVFSQNLSPILTDGRNTSGTTTKTVTGSLCKFIRQLDHKRLNSTTKPCAKSLRKVDFSQALSPILTEATERMKLEETTPEKQCQHNSPNKENVCAIPRKQRYVSSNQKGNLDPKTSTVLFVSKINACNLTPNLSPIQAKTELMSRVPQPTFDFHVVEQEEAVKEAKQTPTAVVPIVTSTPDSKRGREPLLPVDLSSVAPPSVGEDELLPLRISGDIVNSDEIACASDVSLEVDIPNVQAADVYGHIPDSSDLAVEVTNSGSTTAATHTSTELHTKAKQEVKLKPDSTGLTKRTVLCKLSQAARASNGVNASHGHSVVANARSLKSWMYLPGCSNGSNINGKTQKAAAQVEHTHPSQHPLCYLVGVVKNCQMARAPGKVKVMSKSRKLMVAIAQAPPDAIRATAGRVTQV